MTIQWMIFHGALCSIDCQLFCQDRMLDIIIEFIGHLPAILGCFWRGYSVGYHHARAIRRKRWMKNKYWRISRMQNYTQKAFVEIGHRQTRRDEMWAHTQKSFEDAGLRFARKKEDLFKELEEKGMILLLLISTFSSQSISSSFFAS